MNKRDIIKDFERGLLDNLSQADENGKYGEAHENNLDLLNGTVVELVNSGLDPANLESWIGQAAREASDARKANNLSPYVLDIDKGKKIIEDFKKGRT